MRLARTQHTRNPIDPQSFHVSYHILVPGRDTPTRPAYLCGVDDVSNAEVAQNVMRIRRNGAANKQAVQDTGGGAGSSRLLEDAQAAEHVVEPHLQGLGFRV